MGMIFNYLRLRDDQALAELIYSTDGLLIGHDIDVVETKEIDPMIALGALVSLVLDVPLYESDPTEARDVWPALADETRHAHTTAAGLLLVVTEAG